MSILKKLALLVFIVLTSLASAGGSYVYALQRSSEAYSELLGMIVRAYENRLAAKQMELDFYKRYPNIGERYDL